MATPGTEPQRSLFFQPDISRVNSAESNEKKTHGISPQLQAMTFTSLAAEGDMLQKNANYDRAVQSYTKALDFRPGDRITLVSRSRCFMLMGKTELALKDADKVLEGDRNYVRGILQKAETHFTAGDFEQALVFYHRGGKIRPDMEEFRLGIQKAKEAIDDALCKCSFTIPISNSFFFFFFFLFLLIIIMFAHMFVILLQTLLSHSHVNNEFHRPTICCCCLHF
eukprot:TRINITY_DN6526_c0_g1_i2.p1 TRINITY_DN6526_c0_g1~~TRINITY_DN6526_c0_g1_i2.p1  ORF type:complete len:224 (-),score=42.96 TRINITY_DN6526_c0_g1_i2:147-818(-)